MDSKKSNMIPNTTVQYQVEQLMRTYVEQNVRMVYQKKDIAKKANEQNVLIEKQVMALLS